MSEIKRGALQSPASTARTVDTIVRHVQNIDAAGNVIGSGSNIVLTDDAGLALIPDTQNTGMYVIPATGAQTKYFYLSWDGSLITELINLRYLVDQAVTLAIELQILALGALNWQPLPAHTAAMAADGTSQEMNSNYPLREMITEGTQFRVAATTGGAANIGIQAVRA